MCGAARLRTRLLFMLPEGGHGEKIVVELFAELSREKGEERDNDFKCCSASRVPSRASDTD